MQIVEFAVVLAVGGAALTVLAYLAQTWMVFPTYLVRDVPRDNQGETAATIRVRKRRG